MDRMQKQHGLIGPISHIMQPNCRNVYTETNSDDVHIGVGNLTIIGSDHGVAPTQGQAIIWTNAGILLAWPLRTKLNEISIKIWTFSFKKMNFKMSSAKWRPFCLGLSVIMLVSKKRRLMWLSRSLLAAHNCTLTILPSLTGRPRQNGRHFADDFFKCIFLYENVWILIKISLKFVSRDPINNIPASV